MSKNKSTVSKKKLKKAFKTIEKTGLNLAQIGLNPYQEKAGIDALDRIYRFHGESTPDIMKETLLYAIECIIRYENKAYDEVNEHNILLMRMLYDLFDTIEQFSNSKYLKALCRNVIHSYAPPKDLQEQSKEPLFSNVVEK